MICHSLKIPANPKAADNRFDAVTAFETVHFWPNLPRCFREVYRVLKPDGTFLICNESNGDPGKETRSGRISLAA